nr:hypothetical protein CFP56_24432 [Quercus suber]
MIPWAPSVECRNYKILLSRPDYCCEQRSRQSAYCRQLSPKAMGACEHCFTVGRYLRDTTSCSYCLDAKKSEMFTRQPESDLTAPLVGELPMQVCCSLESICKVSTAEADSRPVAELSRS